MTSLNNILSDKTCPKKEPEVLIELPEPKSISGECTIIMNGHHNYGLTEDKYSAIIEEVEEETEPFLNHVSSHLPSSYKSDSIASSNSIGSTVISSSAFPLKESSVVSSPEEDSDAEVEPESSTRLLHSQDHENTSSKCLKNKAKLPSFKSSPSKRQTVTDSHSHIQHRPLGLPQNTSPSHFLSKSNWSLAHFACLGFVVFIFLGITCISLGLYLTAPSDCETNKQWWQGSVMYEIFPASFQDTDGDGFGDLKGIIERLDYVQNLSINVIRLNSIFSALDYPLEYEHVIDFSNIDPHIGRIEDFEELVREVHSRGMYIVMDLNPTVTSDQHSWAAHWLLHRTGRYEHFYINITDEKEEPPLETKPDYSENDWPPPHRPFGNHFFLNWSNPLLQLEMRNVMEMWLSLGVDGFYMKHAEDLHVNDRLHYLNIIHQWRYILDKYSFNNTRKVLMMSHDTMKFLSSVLDTFRYISIPSMVDLVDVSVKLMNNGSIQNIEEDIEEVRKFWDQFPVSPVLVWHVGSVETMRLGNKVGRGSNMAGFLLVSILPGSFSCFYGDEINLKNSFDPVTNKVYRGGQLAPMAWTSQSQANFTTEDATPWLPVDPNFVIQNVETEQEKLLILKSVIELKQNGKLFPSEPKMSLVHSFVTRLGGQSSDRLQYQWYHNLCGLIVTKIITNNFDYMYIGNFGAEALSFAGEEECVGGNFVFSLYPWKNVQVIISTNMALDGKIELNQLLLEPGDAVIGRLLT